MDARRQDGERGGDARAGGNPVAARSLRLYTQGSAWFSFEESERGALAPGLFADLAVLSKDVLTVPIDEIGSTVSLLTMVGGRIVYGDGPFAGDEEKSAAELRAR